MLNVACLKIKYLSYLWTQLFKQNTKKTFTALQCLCQYLYTEKTM